MIEYRFPITAEIVKSVWLNIFCWKEFLLLYGKDVLYKWKIVINLTIEN